MKQILLLVLSLLIVTSISQAQDRTVSGKVTSAEDGTSLPGVNVVVKGTTNGGVTDIDGNYKISVPEGGEILVFSFIGLKTQEVQIGTRNVIDVQMASDVTQLSEIVVVGYGTTTKKSFVGTAKSVDVDKITEKSYTNVSQAMAGEVAGVNVINTSGQPGNVSTVRIRGFGSVNGNRNPLYVVDGVPLTNDDDGVTGLNGINPADITSYTVLKDATATAIYGARGANGVIVITTKTGSKDKSSIDIEYKGGTNLSYLPRYDIIQSPEEYAELTWEGMKNRGIAQGEADPIAYANDRFFSGGGFPDQYNMWNVANGGELIDPNTGKVRAGVTRKYDPENWRDYGFQNAATHEGNVRFSGGSDNGSHYISLGYLNSKGYITNSDYTRFTVRSNINQNINNWLTASTNIAYTMSDQNRNGQSNDSGSVFWFADNIPSIYPLFLRDTDGNIVEDPIYGGNQYDYGIGRGFGALTNSIADAHYDKINYKNSQLIGNVAFTVDFTDWLAFEAKYGIQHENRNYINRGNPYYGSSATQGGSLFRQLREDLTQNFLQMLRFNKAFGVHNVDALLAHESNSWKRQFNTISKNKAVSDDIDDFNNYIIVSSPPTGYTQGTSLESYFGQANYNYDGKYFLSASLRRDGSSRFVKDKWGTFWSVGGAWVLSQESFLQVNAINFLKLRASYGLIGEQQGVGYYPGYNTFAVGNLNDNYAITPEGNGNPDLTWETSKMLQGGIEFEVLNSRIEGVLDFYQKTTDNLLFDRRIGPSSGIAIITVNDGSLVNQGLEYDLTGHIIDNWGVKLDLSINGAFLSNEIKKMPIDPSTGLPKAIDTSNSPYGMAEGHSIFDYYMVEWAGVDPADGVGMWYQYYNDINSNGEVEAGEGIDDMVTYLDNFDGSTELNIQKTVTKTYSNATRKFVDKSAIPKVSGGFRLNASYKNFTLTTQFLYSLGGYAYDGAYANLMNNVTAGNNNWHTDIYARWQQPGDITDVPRLSNGLDTNVASRSTRYLIKSDYLSLNNVRLGYEFPKDIISKLHISGLNVWVSGDNLMLMTHRKGFNPSTSETGGSSTYRYSPLTTITAGLRASF